MTCNDFALECLQAEGHLSETAREHLQSCPDCQAFTRLNSILLQPRPSPELDRRILQIAGLLLHHQPRRRWWQEINHYFYAAAAVLLVLLSVYALSLPPAGGKSPDLLAQSGETGSATHDLLILSYLETTNEMDNIEQQLYLYAGN
ncbi:MAG: hypothetical protein GX564_12715 [Oligosphaeraceae bacterium]|jgi:hypothetical protein|nr:hypothetical protein [Oligosphaeraceae bacterium]